MREIIGVENWFSIFAINDIVKKEALFFDKIAIPHLSEFLKVLEFAETKKPKIYSVFEKRFSATDSLKEAQWLIENGFLFETTHQFDNQKLNANADFQAINQGVNESIKSIAESFQKDGVRTVVRFFRQLKNFDSDVKFNDRTRELFEKLAYITEDTNRLFAIQLRELENLDAYPIIWGDIRVNDSTEVKKTDTIQITLKSLPMPSEKSSWEQIKDFRDDKDSRQKFLDLRNWMNEVARAKLTPLELEQKLEYLINQYQKHIDLHDLKTNKGTLETIVVSGAEIIEDLARFKFSKAVKLLFSFSQRKIALKEGEMNAKGNEVAYIIKAREKF